MHNFKFPLGAILRDKDLFDEVLVVGRLLDADQNMEPVYIIKRPHRIDWYTAVMVEEWFNLSDRQYT